MHLESGFFFRSALMFRRFSLLPLLRVGAITGDYAAKDIL